MIIVAGGDSFIFGSELKSKENTFTAILSKSFEYICVAEPGFSNDSISRTVITECNKHRDIGVIVSWTFPGRYEFRFSYDTMTMGSPWYSINSWTTEDSDTLKLRFAQKSKIYYDGFKMRHNIAEKTGCADFARVYFQHVGHSEYWETYTTLKEIIYLQNYLELQKIPYLFTCASTDFLNNNTIKNPDEYISGLYNLINFKSWFLFDNDKGFYQWALANKYPVGALHPLDDAHIAAAQLIKDKFNELVTKPLESNKIRN